MSIDLHGIQCTHWQVVQVSEVIEGKTNVTKVTVVVLVGSEILTHVILSLVELEAWTMVHSTLPVRRRKGNRPLSYFFHFFD